MHALAHARLGSNIRFSRDTEFHCRAVFTAANINIPAVCSRDTAVIQIFIDGRPPMAVHLGLTPLKDSILKQTFSF
jgi:hypothetical protein